MKKILTVQDFSCVGKCSLTVALPLVSAFGIETCALPTALLSNHTAFKHWTFKNLCDEILPITKAWENEGFTFDGFYAGYLGGKDIIESCKFIIDEFVKNGPVLIDPAMGDNGKLYAGFDSEYVLATKSLCSKADIVTPNITEACFMLNKQFVDGYNKEYLDELSLGLVENGAKNVVITGIKRDDEVGVYCTLENGERFEYFTKREAQDFHGTGDVYSSAIFGAIMNGKSIKQAAAFACDFTKQCIAATLSEKDHVDYGVNFEECLHLITEFIKKT